MDDVFSRKINIKPLNPSIGFGVYLGCARLVRSDMAIGAYGEDLELGEDNTYSLADLLEDLCSLEYDFRIRLSSIDPAHIDERLIELLRAHPKICPHLHLSLQSGNALILKRMKRRYSSEQVYTQVVKLRESIPDLVLSADIMVGFPTESESHFMDTLRMVRQLEISYPHVFPYSERSGTPAARIPPDKQVPVSERKSRAQILRRVGSEVRRKVLHSRVGLTGRILIEGGHCPITGYQKGRASNYIEVWTPIEDGRTGQWADVRYLSVHGDALIGARGQLGLIPASSFKC